MRSSSSAIQAPRPAGSRLSTTIWYEDLPAKVVMRPVAMTSSPSWGRWRRRPNTPFQTTASMRA
ncbi:hypothetical protein ABIE45_002983 [Methylobacterium sp. OAE515]